MLNRLVEFHLEHKLLVLAGLTLLLAFGLYSLSQIPIDAFPDLTNNQVVVITDCPAMPPSEVEMLVSWPIEQVLMGLPHTETIRSISKLGLSMVTIVFDDSVNTYFARQLVNERLQEVRARIPESLMPQLGPVATAFGEIYQYTLEGDGLSPMELKTLHDWQIKPQLRSVPGINEVNTWGCETRQYHIEVDPVALQRYGLSFRDIFERVRDNNTNFGGGFIRHGAEQYTVRGLGRTQSIADLENIVLLARAGTPVLLRDVASVVLHPMPRQGAVTRDGDGETVSGMTIMLKGENGREVNRRVKEKFASLSLPAGVKIVPFYDQAAVIDRTIRTVRNNLFEGGALVLVVLLLFLGDFRAAIIVASVIPLSMLIGFIGMRLYGVSANLMSLGAIDFGMLVDGAIVMMENCVRHLHREPGDSGYDPAMRIREAATEVTRPITFGVAIIMAVYIPIFFLEGLEGRMFRPMAITLCAALLGSLVLALTVVPTAALTFLSHGVTERGEHWFEAVRLRYQRALEWFFDNRGLAIAVAGLAVAVSVGSLAYIGTEFMPRLDEGSILITLKKLPGISLEDSVRIGTGVEQILRGFPEISGVVSKTGRPDLATEAMGIYESDVYVLLRPTEQWKRFSTKEELINALAAALEPVPGIAVSFTQPMAMRLDETVSGVKSDLAIKIFGDDPRILEELAGQVLRVVSTVRGAADEQKEVISGIAELRVDIDRTALARYGLNVSDVRDIMEVAVGGKAVSQFIDGQRRFDIVVHLPDSYRADLDRIRSVVMFAPAGERVLLSQVARVFVARGPEVVNRENAQRRIVVMSNVRGRDLGSFVDEVQRKIGQAVRIPPGYWIDWGGQFENQARAMKRLTLVVPASALIIFGILFATFNSVPQALLVLLNVPFALIGGIASLWLRDLNLNLSASVGFIALFGVAVLNGIIIVSSINRLRSEGVPIYRAVQEGASMRLRPVLMTGIVPGIGFIPMAVNTSMGSEVQRPLATVVIGGLVTSTILTMFLLPLLYPWFSPREAVEEVPADKL